MKEHAIHRVTGFEIVGPYTLDIRFADGGEQRIDFSPVLKGELYSPLKDRSLFEQVRIDPEVHTLVWPNGADFDPAILRHWPRFEEAFKARAKDWAAAGDRASTVPSLIPRKRPPTR